MDLEVILLEFALSFNEKPLEQKVSKDPNTIALDLYKRIREFAAKHKSKPDLLAQYQQAIDNEQYEIAHILKNQIMEIIEQNGKRTIKKSQ